MLPAQDTGIVAGYNFFIQIAAMFNRVDPSQQGILNPQGAVAMGGGASARQILRDGSTGFRRQVSLGTHPGYSVILYVQRGIDKRISVGTGNQRAAC